MSLTCAPAHSPALQSSIHCTIQTIWCSFCFTFQSSHPEQSDRILLCSQIQLIDRSLPTGNRSAQSKLNPLWFACVTESCCTTTTRLVATHWLNAASSTFSDTVPKCNLISHLGHPNMQLDVASRVSVWIKVNSKFSPIVILPLHSLTTKYCDKEFLNSLVDALPSTTSLCLKSTPLFQLCSLWSG